MSNNNRIPRAVKVAEQGNKSEIRSYERSQDRGYWLYNFTLGYIPYKKTNDTHITRHVYIGGSKKTITIQGHHELGLPYGKIPRLLILYFITQAKKGNQRIDVSHISQFVRDLGVRVQGRDIRRVKEELIKLNALQYHHEDWKDGSYESDRMTITDVESTFKISWLEKDGNIDKNEGNNIIILSKKFYDYAQKHAFPIDKDIVKVLSQSALAFEIYMFLTYNHNQNFKLDWTALKQRFGQSYKDDVNGRKNFKKDFTKQFGLVQAAYKSNRSRIDIKQGLQLLQSTASVSRKKRLNQVEAEHEAWRE